MSTKAIVQAAIENKPKTVSNLIDRELKVRAFNAFEDRKTELAKEIIKKPKVE